jgi:hypothetical protein
MVQIELAKFYLSKISFIDSKGEIVEVEDIALVDLNTTGLGMVNLTVPMDSYKSIKFGVGVQPDLNVMTPSDFTEEDHPLSSTQNTYWGMNGMYRFAMIDGRYDLENDNIFDGTFSYHTGFDESYREVELVQDFKFKKKKIYDITIYIELSKILEGSAGNLDLVNRPSFHGNPNDMDLATSLSDNFAEAFSF